MAQIIAERVEDYVCVIRLVNAPEGFLTPGMLPALASAIDSAAATPAVRAIVLTGGQSRVFVQHYWDTDATVQLTEETQSTEGRALPASFPNRLRALCTRIERCPKPVIAAINGTCLGGGLELALACDFRVAQAGDYSIGFTEIHLGVLPGGGGTQRLVRLLGAARAFEMIALAKMLTPEEAASRGVVNFVAPSALEGSMKLARRLAAQPAKALAHLKTLVNAAKEPGASEAHAHDEEAMCLDLWESREAAVRMTAFNRGEFDVREDYPESVVRERKSGVHATPVTSRKLRLV
jgi:enoyl-CoA hydratase/carnithine racemase